MAALASAPVALRANLVLDVAHADNSVQVSWMSTSLTTNTPFLHYDFQLEASPDLVHWTNTGAPILGGVLSTSSAPHTMVVPQEGGVAFYRLRSQLRLPGATLPGLQMPGADLRGADLSGADLTAADLSGAILAGANFTGTTLTGAKLDGALLADTSFRNAIGRPRIGALGGDPGIEVARVIPRLRYYPVAADYPFDPTHVVGGSASPTIVVVSPLPTTSVAQFNALLASSGGRVVGSIPGIPGKTSGLLTLQLPTTGATIDGVVSEWRTNGLFAAVTRDRAAVPTALPEDTAAAAGWTWSWPADDGNWGMELMGAPQLWNFTEALVKREGGAVTPITVGVVEGGMVSAHEDLAFTLTRTGPAQAIAPALYQAHGAHVSGTIAALHGNSKGVQGVSPFVDLLVEEPGGVIPTEQWQRDAVENLASLGAQVINISISIPWYTGTINPNTDVPSQTDSDASGLLTEQLIHSIPTPPVLCVAAGNDSGAANLGSAVINARWASCWANAAVRSLVDNILVVEAVGAPSFASLQLADLARSDFSNNGGTVAGPGENILSCSYPQAYEIMQGTSMATPHVTGICAYLLALDPSLGYADLIRLIKDQALAVPAGVTPFVQAWRSAMAIDGLKSSHPADQAMLKMLLDIDDGTPDGNERVAAPALNLAQDRWFEPVAGADVNRDDFGDGVIDMSDFRRWRDWYLLGESPNGLNGSSSHLKHDANRDGRVESNHTLEIDRYPRGDFNGDGFQDRDSRAHVPGALKDVETTDLGVIVGSGLWADEYQTNVAQLGNLVDSADLRVSAAAFYTKSAVTAPAVVSVRDAATRLPIPYSRPFAYARTNTLHLFTVPVGAKYYVSSDPIPLGDGRNALARSVPVADENGDPVDFEIPAEKKGADYAVDLSLVEMTAIAEVQNPTVPPKYDSRPDAKEVDAHIPDYFVGTETNTLGARGWANDQATLYAVANAKRLDVPPEDPNTPSTFTGSVRWQRGFIKDPNHPQFAFDIKPLMLRLSNTSPPGTEWTALAEILLEMRAYDLSPVWQPVFYYHAEIAGESTSGGQPATFHIVRQEGDLPDATLTTTDSSAEYRQQPYKGKKGLTGIPDGHTFELRYQLTAQVFGRGVDSEAFAYIGDPLHYGSGTRMEYGGFGELPSVTSLSTNAQGHAELTYRARTNFYYRLYRGTNIDTAGLPLALKLGSQGPDSLIDPSPIPGSSIDDYILENQPIDQPLDVDGDGIDDVYEMLHPTILNPLNDADARNDADGDGRSNLQEYLDGTDPAVADGGPPLTGDLYPARQTDLGLNATPQIADLNNDGVPDVVALSSYPQLAFVSRLGHTNGTWEPTVSTPVTNVGFSGIFTTARLNGDAFPDLLVINQLTNLVWVLLGDGAGGFTLGPAYTVGAGPIRVTAGDVNGDGILDALVLNGTPRTVTVLIGNGDGTFQPGHDTALGGAIPSDLTLAQLVPGSPRALVVTLQSSHRVAVFPGNGDGTFGIVQTNATGSTPVRVVAGDLNGDGRDDVVTSNTTGDNVSVFLSNADGTLQPGANYFTGDIPRDLVLVDLDGDGDLDVVVGHVGADYHAVLLNDSHGLLVSGAPVYTANTGTCLVADFNHDGRPDILTPGSGGTFVSLGLGSARFDAARELVITGLDPTDLQFEDLDGDGRLDVLIPNRRSNTVEVVSLTASNDLQRLLSIPVASQVQSARAARLDAGNTIDLAVTTIRPDFQPGTSSNELHVLLGDGSGGFAAQPALPLADAPSSVAAADFNGDGALDLLVLLGSSGQAAPFLGQGNGAFTAAPLLALGGSAFYYALGEFNGDARADLVAQVNVGNSGRVRVYHAATDGSLSQAQEITPLDGASAGPLTLQDMDGDGRADLVVSVATISGAKVVFYPSKLDGTFGAEQALPVTGFYFGQKIEMLDLNGDGRLDLLSGSTLWLANSTGGFDGPQRYATSNGLLTRARDLNGDGRPELVSANSSSAAVRVLVHR